MSFINCFNVVSSVVEEANERFSPRWRLDQERYQILEQYCSVIDALIEEFDGESIEVSVDEDITMCVAIVLECPELTIQSKEHKFYDLIQRCIAFSFSQSDEENLEIKFIFPSLWIKNNPEEIVSKYLKE